MPQVVAAPTPSCACCAFSSLGNDLFLPRSNERGSTIDKLEEHNSSSSNLSVTNKSDNIIAAPREAWDRILASSSGSSLHRPILLVDTHGHPHLQREVQYASHDDDGIDDYYSTMMQSIAGESVVSLTCAVSPLDWKVALEYASQSSRILPALGIHPWYLGDILVNDNNMDKNNKEGQSNNIERYIDWRWLNDLETHLSEHPRLIIGEIGLCKMARFVRDFPKNNGGKSTAIALQKLVFSKQLQLAARWLRPVTVHCVDAHGMFMETLWEILRQVKEDSCPEEVKEDGKKHWRTAFPSAIAMHSFTGTAHQVNEILAFERALLDPEGEDGNKAILFYFGVSHSINHLMCTSEKSRKKGMEAIRSIPANRLLVESDVHASVDVTLGTAGAVAYAAHVRDERIEDVAKLCVGNGLRFLST